MAKRGQYFIAEADSKRQLQLEVETLLHAGQWRLVGGVAVVQHKSPDSSSHLRFYQALTKGGRTA